MLQSFSNGQKDPLTIDPSPPSVQAVVPSNVSVFPLLTIPLAAVIDTYCNSVTGCNSKPLPPIVICSSPGTVTIFIAELSVAAVLEYTGASKAGVAVSVKQLALSRTHPNLPFASLAAALVYTRPPFSWALPMFLSHSLTH